MIRIRGPDPSGGPLVGVAPGSGASVALSFGHSLIIGGAHPFEGVLGSVTFVPRSMVAPTILVHLSFLHALFDGVFLTVISSGQGDAPEVR